MCIRDSISTDDVAVAQELGYVIKLVGDVREVESGISAEVSPTFLPKNHPLASVNDVMNAVFVESIGIGESMYYGPGAVSYTHLDVYKRQVLGSANTKLVWSLI